MSVAEGESRNWDRLYPLIRDPGRWVKEFYVLIGLVFTDLVIVSFPQFTFSRLILNVT